MKFYLTIDCDNAAFDGDDCAQELARIVWSSSVTLSASDLALRRYKEYLHDRNGNTVGRAWIEE